MAGLVLPLLGGGVAAPGVVEPGGDPVTLARDASCDGEVGDVIVTQVR